MMLEANKYIHTTGRPQRLHGATSSCCPSSIHSLIQVAIQELDEAAGAMKILEVLKASGKPMVGHNFLLDLLFLYS